VAVINTYVSELYRMSCKNDQPIGLNLEHFEGYKGMHVSLLELQVENHVR